MANLRSQLLAQLPQLTELQLSQMADLEQLQFSSEQLKVGLGVAAPVGKPVLRTDWWDLMIMFEVDCYDC